VDQKVPLVIAYHTGTISASRAHLRRKARARSGDDRASPLAQTRSTRFRDMAQTTQLRSDLFDRSIAELRSQPLPGRRSLPMQQSNMIAVAVWLSVSTGVAIYKEWIVPNMRRIRV
jgi:hypothetical protein